jgi:parallel beta-helix repeat protein
MRSILSAWLAGILALSLGCMRGMAYGATPANVFRVGTTAASGAGSLQQALARASVPGGPTRIEFSIPQTDRGFDAADGVWTIRLGAALPGLSRGGVTIDGLTQPAAGGKPDRPRIVLAAASRDVEHALVVTSTGNVIRGLHVGGFKYGVVLHGPAASDNVLEFNHVGETAGRGGALANETGILLVDGARGNTLRRNVISGNEQVGVFLGGQGTSQNLLLGNLVGCDVTGAWRMPNGVGVMINRASGNAVGGSNTGDGNLISGNESIGILLVGKWTERNAILGNGIGVDRAGERPLSNNIGIVIKSLANGNFVGGAGTGQGNVISGNREIGLYIEAADGNRILGNLIGTDRSGLRAVGDGEVVQGNGVEFNTVARDNVLGGTLPGERNIISGHQVYGVVYYGHCSRNATLGNYIGTDITGNAPLPNATGICVDCASHHNDIAQNVISGNMSYGLFFVTRGTEHNRLLGNSIGTNAAGDAALPNDIGMVISTGAARNQVGGPAPADRNIISGNRRSGIMITNRLTEENQVLGNFIGLDAGGTRALGNEHGILLATYPRANVVRGNVISANRTAGIVLCEYAEANEVAENRFGTDAAGQARLGVQGVAAVLDQQACNNLIRSNIIVRAGAGGIVLGGDVGPGNRQEGNRLP